MFLVSPAGLAPWSSAAAVSVIDRDVLLRHPNIGDSSALAPLETYKY